MVPSSIHLLPPTLMSHIHNSAIVCKEYLGLSNFATDHNIIKCTITLQYGMPFSIIVGGTYTFTRGGLTFDLLLVHLCSLAPLGSLAWTSVVGGRSFLFGRIHAWSLPLTPLLASLIGCSGLIVKVIVKIVVVVKSTIAFLSLSSSTLFAIIGLMAAYSIL